MCAGLETAMNGTGKLLLQFRLVYFYMSFTSFFTPLGLFAFVYLMWRCDMWLDSVSV
jgi:hypothetical protein